MRRNLLDALWAMAVLTSVVLVVLAAGSLVVALTADTTSAVGLDAWRGVVVMAPALVIATTILAVLTSLRLRRGAHTDGEIDATADGAMLTAGDATGAVVHIVVEPTPRIAP